MKNASLVILILTTTLSLSPMAFAQEAKTDPGASLKVTPPDLTVLAKNNGRVFPTDRISSSVIDGRAQIATHGTRDMPIWGTRYAVNAAEHFFDAPYDQEAYIRAHILILVDYLNRVQQK
jgi:hypothetical protein